MKTVGEISKLSKISVRTLHYYDEIGLLSPTIINASGYRLYDDKALETLKQILFFREFDIPLKDIKTILTSPSFDKIKVLKMQKKLLSSKLKRTKNLIADIDKIIKGENELDFTVFDKSEIEELCEATLKSMPENIIESIKEEFGSIENWRNHYIEVSMREDMQKGYQKMIEWYGDKESALNAMKNPPSKKVLDAFETRVEKIETKLYERRSYPITSFEVKEVIGELGFIMKKLYQVKNEKGLMEMMASSFQDERIKSRTDERYGDGASEFFALAINNFYKEK